MSDNVKRLGVVEHVRDAEERFGKGSEIAMMTRALSAPPRPPAPPPAPREPDPPVAWESERQRLLAEALDSAYGGCCDDSPGVDAYWWRAKELLAELDACKPR